VSAEKSVLLDRLGLVAAGKPDKTLAGRRKAFAAEVSKPAVAAGFVSLAGILRGAELPHAQVELQKLPKKGLAPIPFRIEAVGGAGSELTMRLTADRGLAADLMAIFPLLVKARSLGGASGSEEE